MRADFCICRLKSEQNYSEKQVPEKAHFIGDASKSRDIIYLNVETWLLFAPPHQNFWLGACPLVPLSCHV